MNYSLGSLSNKWDLHIHTPYSIEHQYNCSEGEDVWEKFIKDLEALPQEFKVIGINDYIFIDGYRKVLEYKKSGRLKNIDLILPVIELRLNKFGGSQSRFSRINYHIIFSDGLSPDTIQGQFLNALSNTYELSPRSQEGVGNWNAIPTKESVAELGKLIKASVPKVQLSQYGSDIREGFNNLNFDKTKILDILNQSCFQDKYLTAIGKTEWEDVKWTAQSIAEKKDLINGCDFVFTSADNLSNFMKGKNKLKAANVNDLLLDCSDAHQFSNSTDKDRIGNSMTWLKCDTTFQGLKQILNEPDGRIFIGDSPPKFEIVRKNPTKYIKSISVNEKNGNTENGWFNVNIPLNQDLVAIIGNKGNGKSALADIIGLLGATKNSEFFSFLRKDRFRSKGLAENFSGSLEWNSGKIDVKLLDQNPAAHEEEKVKYLPQQFLEKLCNEDEDRFEVELKKVIFSHVHTSDRLGEDSLDGLIKTKTKTLKSAIDLLVSDITDINEEIITMEALQTTENKNIIEERLKSLHDDCLAHETTKPEEIKKVENNPAAQEQMGQITSQINTLQVELLSLKSIIGSKEEEHQDIKKKLVAIQRVEGNLKNFKKQYNDFQSEIERESTTLDIDLKEVVNLSIDTKQIEELKQKCYEKDKELRLQLNPESDKSLLPQKSSIVRKIESLKGKLDEPNRKYQGYLKSIEEWKSKKMNILDALEAEKRKLKHTEEELPSKLEEKKIARIDKVKKIHEQFQERVEIYEDFYTPVQSFITKHELTNDSFKLNFEVSIVNKNFSERFFDLINQSLRGKFLGRDEGQKHLKKIIDETDFNSKESLVTFINSILSSLNEKNEEEPESVNIKAQLKKNAELTDFYSYLFSFNYLQPTYSLKLDDKELSMLSPGEKGALLLIFYLLVDNDDIPLVIDQPEENLDNQTVYKLLVPCIKEAKNRRQIIIVTHNANLAVVCDAEQIIYASIDKTKDNKITYKSGAIENPSINQKVIDILEGTKPAFKKRGSKYLIRGGIS